MGAERPIPCAEVRDLVGAFVSGGLRRRSTRRMRAHLSGCEECSEHYRAAVETTAQLGHGQRVERVAVERAQRRWRLRRDAFAAQASPRSRFARLRTLVYPAFFAFLMVQLGAWRGVPRTGLPVEALGGEVSAAPTIHPGELCATGAKGRARLGSDDRVALLEADTRVLLEDLSPPRLRLIDGTLELTGAWRVVTTLGVVEVDEGKVRLTLDGAELQCHSESGVARLIGSRGERTVSPGEIWVEKGF